MNNGVALFTVVDSAPSEAILILLHVLNAMTTRNFAHREQNKYMCVEHMAQALNSTAL
jgi:hypothetical protein